MIYEKKIFLVLTLLFLATEITHIFKLIMLKHWPLFFFIFMEITTVKTGATTRAGLQHTANTHIRFTYAVWGYLFAKKTLFANVLVMKITFW